jgi:hypothetical protein
VPITPEEQREIDAWLAKKGPPVRYPTGYSAVFDEFGNRRVGERQRLAALAKTIRRLHRYEHMAQADIARKLSVPIGDVTLTCARHNIRTKG